jgi:uncharacterized protein YbaA (DUF1428 family)
VAYIAHVAAAAPLFKAFGAIRVVEAWGDDIPDGKLTDYFMPFDGKRMIYGSFAPILDA